MKKPQFIPGQTLSAVAPDDDGVTLELDGAPAYRAHYVVGADGANSRVRQLTGDGAMLRRAFALEGLVAYEALAGAPEMTVDLHAVAGGYGWLFPKADHMNVGLGSFARDGALSKDALRDYARRRLGTDALSHIQGHPLGMGGERYRPAHERVLLAGDAAGMAEPLFGEGIHNAVATGQAAAAAIGEALASGAPAAAHYMAALAPLRCDIDICARVAKYLYPAIGIGYRLLRVPAAQKILMRAFAEGLNTEQVMATYFPSPRRMLRQYGIALPRRLGLS